MDAALLRSVRFWRDSTASGWGPVPDLPELRGHVLFETSGSSGVPKSVALSKSALLESAAAVNRHLGVTSASRWALALPVHHVGGFGVVARCYESGARLWVHEGKWNASSFCDAIARERVTHTSLVPTQVHDLVTAGHRAAPSLSALVVGGGKLDLATGQRARDLGWPVLASYGMTEAASQIATQPLAALAEPYQAAPLPLLPVWQGRTTADARLEIAGPALFSGYLMAGIYHPRTSEWHLTSDRVALENDQLTPLGRADTIVKILGELVDPAEVERELMELSHETLAEGHFAILAVPDERAGYRLVPVFEPSLPAAAADSAIAAYHDLAPGFRRLEPAWFSELPKSGLGKIRRGDLLKAYLAAGGM